MKYIYIDSLFFLSLFTDYLLCLITARICRPVSYTHLTLPTTPYV